MQLLLIDTNLGPSATAEIRKAANPETLTTLVDLNDTNTCITILDGLRNVYIFKSIGLVMDGNTSPEWSRTTMNPDFASALKNVLVETGSAVDVFACRIHTNDLAIYQLSANLGSGVPVYISINRTGNRLVGQDWILETSLVGSVTDTTYTGDRNLKTLYFTDEILKSTVNFAHRKRSGSRTRTKRSGSRTRRSSSRTRSLSSSPTRGRRSGRRSGRGRGRRSGRGRGGRGGW